MTRGMWAWLIVAAMLMVIGLSMMVAPFAWNELFGIKTPPAPVLICTVGPSA